ncbi:MAG: P1 family peptidase [Firmicutes bacterium]|nr:P1 family peptidase [Bacillota bacterium]
MQRPRLRDWGVKIGQYATGKHNAITDVKGVKVGHATIISGEGKLVRGKGPIRTGVTAILPHSHDLFHYRVAAGSFTLNGAGLVTGLAQAQEWGAIETPIMLTNTLSVGQVHDAVLDYLLQYYPEAGISSDPIIPLVAECDDSHLNDIQGRHVTREHVFEALEQATSGPVAEGCVGAGTGMIAFDFKAGIGTASRVLPNCYGGYTVGALILANFGPRHCFQIAGCPVGCIITDLLPDPHPDGSIVVVIATDAPLTSLQLRRVAKRAALGIGRTGGYASHVSGEFCLAFSTSTIVPRRCSSLTIQLELLRDQYLDPIFQATIEATEEAIINSLLQATDMRGRDDHIVYAVPLDRLYQLLKKQGLAT